MAPTVELGHRVLELSGHVMAHHGVYLVGDHASDKYVMDYLQHVVITRQDAKLYHATCLRCGLRTAAPNEKLLKEILQAHLSRPASEHVKRKRKAASAK